MKSVIQVGHAGHRRTARGEAGSTLLELVIVVAVLLVVMGGALTVVFNSQIGFAEQMEVSVIESNGRHISERLTNEIREAYPTSVLPLIMTNSKFVTFQKVIGFQNGVVQLGPATTLGFTLATGEQENARDDNGDGRVDEGYVTFTQGNTAIRLVGDVLGMRFTAATGGIAFSVDIGRVDREGQVTRKTFSAGVAFRNQ